MAKAAPKKVVTKQGKVVTKKPVPAKKRVPAKPKATCSRDLAGHRIKVFMEAYVANGGIGKDAAIKAGFSAKTATQQANRLLRLHPEIKAAIKERREEVCQKMELTTERILLELARIAFFDIRKLFSTDGTLKALHELDDDTAAALASVEVYEEFDDAPAGTLQAQAHGGALKRPGKKKLLVGYTKKVKANDKNAALEKAMKYRGLFEKDNEQKGNAFAEFLSSCNGTSLPFSKDV